MAVTQKDIDALEAAINTGAMRVRYADRDVTYRSLAEMEGLLGRMKEKLAGTTRQRFVRVNSVKGFE